MRRLFSPFRLPALIAPYVLAFLTLPTLSHAQEHTAGAFPTGGAGTGGGLGNQGGLVLDRNDQWLFAVNAGSNELSVFAVDKDGLALTDKQPTGGSTPVSVSAHRGVV